MLVKESVPVFLMDTCVSVPISSEIIMGSTEMLYFSVVEITGNRLVNKNMDMTRNEPADMAIVNKDFFN